MGRKNSSSAARRPNNSSSLEKLQMLRSFVGSSFSENDLSACLSASGYSVEVAAERILTGQFQPNKKLKPSPPTSMSSSTQRPETIVLDDDDNSRPPTEPPAVSTAEPIPKPQRRMVDLMQKTPKVLVPSSVPSATANDISLLKKPKASSPPTRAPAQVTPTNKKKDHSGEWLLCERWISNGTCTQRHGSVGYREVLDIEWTVSNSALVRFRGSRIQGQFPKNLSEMLTPLLRFSSNHNDKAIVSLEAEALMEDTGLPIGADVAFSLRIYLPDPQAFFDVFKGLKSSASTAAATFFGKKNANRKPKLAALPEAAFNLLQWAQYGETFDFERRNHEANDNTSSDAEDENMIEQNEDELNGEGEKMGDAEKIPTWAKSVVDDTSGHGKALAECDGPKGLNVQLRPYQRQALQWMTEREAESDSQELTEQLELLAELSPNRAVAKSPPGDTRIHCECGPVVVADEVASTCTTVSGETKTASHPLWEKRYLASHDLSVAKCFYVQPLFGVGTSHPPRPPQPCRGGILADSMGLGKTMMLLALIGKSKEEDGDEARNKSTLVVGPLSLLTQWQEEIETKTNLTCRVYYGDKKSDDYTGADVVLTTYGSLQSEIQWYLKKKKNDEDAPMPSLLGHSWKRLILDEAHCIKNNATYAAKACGMIESERRWCVSGTIIQNSIDDVFSLLKFLRHEPWCEHSFWKAAIGRVDDLGTQLDRVKRLLAPIMIRRTKETLGADGKPILTLPPIESKTIMVEFSQAEREFYDALHRKSLSLFEGFIKAGTASKSWLAIFSLLHRLRMTCDHVALTVKSHLDEDDWNANITQGGTANAVEADAATTSKSPTPAVTEAQSKDSIDQQFLENLMGKFRNMQAKSKKDQVTDEFLSQVANKLSDAAKSNSSQLEEECSICLEPISLNKSLVTPCLHMFCEDCLINFMKEKALSQAVKHEDDEEQKLPPRILSAIPSGPCPVCAENVNANKILRISQAEPGGEVKTSYLTESQASKARLLTNPNDDKARQVLENAIQGANSSKMGAILSELHNIWEEEAGSKVLVFSQFLGFLDLMEQSFRSGGIPFARLDGKLSLKERVKVLEQFGKAQPKSADVGSSKKIGSVLLVSMKAGGVGLNLVAANSVFICDPWWNASIENQCINRIHRIGQTAEKVRVRKFYVANSVEERIVKLQERKEAVATEVLNDEGVSEPSTNARPSLDDFKILFQDEK